VDEGSVVGLQGSRVVVSWSTVSSAYCCRLQKTAFGDRSTEDCIVCATAVTNWLQPICVLQYQKLSEISVAPLCLNVLTGVFQRVFCIFILFFLFFLCFFSQLCWLYFQSSRRAAIFSI